MSRRKELGNKLLELHSNSNVYFQPPEGFKLSYPCITYEFVDIYSAYADDTHYKLRDKYRVTLISKDGDPDNVRKLLLGLPFSSFERRFISDNLYHDVISTYY